MYVSSGSVYFDTVLYARGTIQDDGGDLQINDNLDVYGGYIYDSNSELILNDEVRVNGIFNATDSTAAGIRTDGTGNVIITLGA